MSARPQKITFAEMRSSGVRGLLIYCADYRCRHRVAINGDRWPDDVRLSDLEPTFICTACGKRGADIRPDFRHEAAYRYGGQAQRFMNWITIRLAKPASNAYFVRMFKAFDFCLPTRSTIVPHGPDWLHEVKYDGYRLRLERDGDHVRLITRGSISTATSARWSSCAVA
jgi:hypothetical protein